MTRLGTPPYGGYERLKTLYAFVTHPSRYPFPEMSSLVILSSARACDIFLVFGPTPIEMALSSEFRPI
jgi:hypothetical protein